jgi:hypothetical protein
MTLVEGTHNTHKNTESVVVDSEETGLEVNVYVHGSRTFEHI